MISNYVFSRHSTQCKTGLILKSKDVFFEYSWVPSLNWSPDSPTLVYFLGYDSKIPRKPTRKWKWNMLYISDSSGMGQKGSWFFGTGGSPDILLSIESFLLEMALSGVLSKSSLFFSGKGMGGHAALYFHALLGGRGCYCHNPTSNLVNSDYSNNKHKEIFSSIFSSKKTHEYQFLPDFLSRSELKGEILISHSESGIFFNEHILPLESLVSVRISEKNNFNFEMILAEFASFVPDSPPFSLKPTMVRESNLALISPVTVSLTGRPDFTIAEEFSFGIDPFDDRSWRFWFQNLSWIKDHLNSLPRSKRKKQFEIIFCKWMEYIEEDGVDREFLYHDHALAYRGNCLIECLEFCPKGLQNEVLEHIMDIGLLLASPLEDNALSNHAFDQSITLNKITQLFKGRRNMRVLRELSIERIKREIEYSFSQDGVHVENSPGYHHGMIANVNNSLNSLLQSPLNSRLKGQKEFLPKMVPYLRWIVRQDGKLPPIGDSEQRQVSFGLAKSLFPEEFNHKNQGMKVFANGYAIWRTEKTHLVMKSIQTGRFHRHDDDCSLTLWHNGEDLLLDSGLLYYKEKDEDRIHVRSATAHSGIEIPGKKAIRNIFNKSAGKASVTKTDSISAMAVMGMYEGFDIKRNITKEGKKIRIVDFFCDASIENKVRQNFIIPACWETITKPDRVIFKKEDGQTWVLECSDQEDHREIEIEKTFVSMMKNQKSEAIRMSFYPKNNKTEISITLDKAPQYEDEDDGRLIEVEITHPNFPAICKKLPINWSKNEYQSKNWIHHLNSLRWITDDENVEQIIRDFYRHNILEKKFNPYFNTRAGDHSATIRLGILAEQLTKCSESLRPIIEEIIHSDIGMLLDKNVYRKGHNHGLIADTALLKMALSSPKWKKYVPEKEIIDRGKETIAMMFHDNGLTKEHSLSYQLWNANFALEFIDVATSYGFSVNNPSREPLLEMTKKLISNFTYTEGFQFALGDSFRYHNTNLIKKIYGENFIHETMISNDGIYFNQEFASLRFVGNNDQEIHMVTTSGYNSHIHKQNDDLSFCLSIDGQIIFDDAGYSDSCNKQQYDFLRSARGHSTLTFSGEDYPDGVGIGKSRILKATDNGDKNFEIVGEHQRLQGHKLVRKMNLDKNGLSIHDSFPESEIEGARKIKRRFVLGDGMKLKFNDNCLEIVDEHNTLSLSLTCEGAKISEFEEGVKVGITKTSFSNCVGFDLDCRLENMNPVFISFNKTRGGKGGQ